MTLALLLGSIAVFTVGSSVPVSSAVPPPTIEDVQSNVRALAGVVSILADDVKLLRDVTAARIEREDERNRRDTQAMSDRTAAVDHLTASIDKMNEEARWRK